MQGPLRITFRNMDSSEFVEARIRKAFAKLEAIDERLTGCHVLVESRHRHHRKGNVFHVAIDLTRPGEEIAVTRDPELDHAEEDVYVAIRDAFDAARRQLLSSPRSRGPHATTSGSGNARP